MTTCGRRGSCIRFPRRLRLALLRSHALDAGALPAAGHRRGWPRRSPRTSTLASRLPRRPASAPTSRSRGGDVRATYGWGWLLAAVVELDALATTLPAAARWRDALAPLAALLAGRLRAWLRAPSSQCVPARTATAPSPCCWRGSMRSAADSALAPRSRSARAVVRQRPPLPGHYEPGGDDFLSGGLCEALLMARCCRPIDGRCGGRSSPLRSRAGNVAGTGTGCRSGRREDRPPARAEPVARLVLAAIAAAAAAAVQETAARAATAHLRASLAAATEGDYAGTHWLALSPCSPPAANRSTAVDRCQRRWPPAVLIGAGGTNEDVLGCDRRRFRNRWARRRRSAVDLRQRVLLLERLMPSRAG